jgi:hypothetical protein
VTLLLRLGRVTIQSILIQSTFAEIRRAARATARVTTKNRALPVVLEYLSCRDLQEMAGAPEPPSDVSILEREMRSAPLLLPALMTSYGNAGHEVA